MKDLNSLPKCSHCGRLLILNTDKKLCKVCEDLYNHIKELKEKANKPMLMDERVELLKEVLICLDKVTETFKE